jgi:DNA-binding response OmpR family regulator
MPATGEVCLGVMGRRTPDADSLEDRPSQPGSSRPLALLVVDDDDLRARFAYQLTVSGFDVDVRDAADLRHTAHRPDVIVAALSSAWPGGRLPPGIADDPRLRGIPVVAITEDSRQITRELARQRGFAALCLTSCSGAALSAGIRAVLDRSEHSRSRQ